MPTFPYKAVKVKNMMKIKTGMDVKNGLM